MIQVNMTAQTRNTFGKGASRVIRRAGKTPAVLYGPKTDPVALELNTKDFTKGLLFINRRNAVVSLNVDEGSVKHVMVKEIQADPVTDTLVHADFIEISLEDKLTLSVPIKYVGKAKGVDLGGELHTFAKSVQLIGKPLDIPDFMEVDVTSLSIGESFCYSDLKIPAGVDMVNDGAKVCASVTSTADNAKEETAAAEA